ncbi:MAG: hypothetical protein OEY89_11305 [Gammaproteobacteria bacterium]|nr:hypothetical protein [Gammaproteobacteria bacterium]
MTDDQLIAALENCEDTSISCLNGGGGGGFIDGWEGITGDWPDD